MIIGTNIDEAVGYRWGGPDGITRKIGPERLAATTTGSIKGIELVILGTNIGTNIDEAVGYHRRGDDLTACSIGPIWFQMGDVSPAEHFFVRIPVCMG